MRYNLYNNFSVYHKERPRHYKRHIEPLSDVEYSRHLFRWPTQPVGSAYQVPGNMCKGVSLPETKRGTDADKFVTEPMGICVGVS